MKKAFVVLLVALQAASCFAGSFIVNIAVLNAREEKVVSIAKALGLEAYIATVESRPGFSLLCDKEADSQDIAYGVGLAKRLSSALASPVVYTLVHDSDILYLQVIRGGLEVFSYDSWPGYFEGADPVPEIRGLEEAAALFGVDAEGLKAILDRSGSDDYVFVDELLVDILEYIDLPSFIALSGYEYISQDTGVYQELGLTLTRIE